MAILERIGETEKHAVCGAAEQPRESRGPEAELSRAEALFLRALALNERIEGPDSFAVSITYQNLGAVARERKDYPKAIEYATRALSIRERLLGADHPDIAQLLNNLANIRHAQGDTPGSLELHFRALRIQEQALGPVRSRHARVRRQHRPALRRHRRHRERGRVSTPRRHDPRRAAPAATGGGLRAAEARVHEDVSERTDRTISLSLHEAAADPDARALAALVLLQRKGRVLDAMIDTFASVRLRSADDADRVLLDQLVRTSRAMRGPRAEHASRGTFRARTAPGSSTLEEERERLEAALSTRSAEFRVRIAAGDARRRPGGDPRRRRARRVRDLPSVRSEGRAEHGRLRPAALRRVRRCAATRRRAPGISVRPRRLTRPSTRCARRCAIARAPISRQRARAVDELVDPVRSRPRSATPRSLLISPDGALNLVPFEAMIDARGRYLIERYAIGYLTSGRDLLRRQAGCAREPRRPAIVADPFFGEPRGRRRCTSRRSPGPRPKRARSSESFPEATLLTQRGATKAALARLEGPRLLHIASHGFFVERATVKRRRSRSRRHARRCVRGVSRRRIRCCVRVSRWLARTRTPPMRGA